ncbi:hypothetical protein [Sulfurimonas sp. NWX79]|uniref:hypothetical protein n=1 Tax=Sulfurimonas sp. NWX79 TaxID=2925412 RepID=UPI003204C4C1
MKILFFFILSFIVVSLSACNDNNKNYDMSTLNSDMDDEADFEEYISDAKHSARNENFSVAYDYLEKARKLGVSNSEIVSAKSYIASKERAYKEKMERKRQERMLRQSQNSSSGEGNLQTKCAILIDNFTAYKACMKDESAIFGLNLNSYYAMRGECNLLAGNDNTGLSYLCQHPNSSGCIGLKAPQETINACYQCGGSNLWLRVYATGTT